MGVKVVEGAGRDSIPPRSSVYILGQIFFKGSVLIMIDLQAPWTWLPALCGSCAGTGKVWDQYDRKIPCGKCAGRGTVYVPGIRKGDRISKDGYPVFGDLLISDNHPLYKEAVAVLEKRGMLKPV